MRLEDLAGPTCAHCGGAMPEGRRVDAIFCSRRCGMADYHATEREARLEAKRGRPPCIRCGAPVAVTKDARAVYCSAACRQAVFWAKRRAAMPERPCAVCGTVFRPRSVYYAGARTCSKRCAALLWRRFPEGGRFGGAHG